tara:strand:+ start:2018 stop:2182 length:165 start_codon:yes stop_codon:yes gene_type:complete
MKTKKISLAVRKSNEDVLDIVDELAIHSGMSRSDFMFKVCRQYHHGLLKQRAYA